jgi:hypothetical protein
MNSQFNSTGEFGINRYGPASGPQHIASAPQQGGDGEMEQRDKEQGGIMGGQRQKRRSERNKSERNKSRRNKSQCGGKRSAKRSEKRRNGEKRRNSEKRRNGEKRQRGGK